MTESEALKTIAVLKAAYPRQEIQEETLRIYLAELIDLDYDLIGKAARTHIRTSQWFPTIAELRAGVAALRPRAEAAPPPMRIGEPMPDGIWASIKAKFPHLWPDPPKKEGSTETAESKRKTPAAPAEEERVMIERSIARARAEGDR